jgi:integrase
MARPKKLRPVSVTIYQGADGLWHGYLPVGVKPNGKPDRRHRSGRTHDECEQKIRVLEDSVAADTVPKPGLPPTVEQWLTHWLENIARPHVSYSTYKNSYRYSIVNHLIPGVGWHRLDKLEADHLEALYRAMLGTERKPGLAPATVALVHRTAHVALAEAVRRGKVGVNAAAIARSVEPDPPEVQPFSVDEARQLLAVTRHRRNGPRWSIALLGPRQGEALGLRWPDFDFDAGILSVRGQAQRRTWQHGCDDPRACARWRHGCADRAACRPTADRCPKRQVRCRVKPCPPAWDHGCDDPGACPATLAYACRRRRPVPCKRHRACSPLCPDLCTGHAQTCPQRVGGGIIIDEAADRNDRRRRTGTRRRIQTKSEAGTRRLGVPDEIVAELREHRQAQLEERMRAGSLWQDNDLIFCSPTGRPIDAAADRREWKAILAEAGVRDSRGHNARHFAATMLLLKGVDRRVVMDVMGWASERMLKRYQHVIDEMRQEAAKRLGSALFGDDNATDHATVAERPRKRRSGGATKGQVRAV